MTIAIAGMADSLLSGGVKENKLWKGVLAVAGIMTTLVIYGLLQEKIMRVPYGSNKEFFKYSLFLVFCNRITTSAVSAAALVASKKALNPVAPVYKYCLISVSNILTTTCQYEALKYVSFPVQTLAKCAKMIPVMVCLGHNHYAKEIQRNGLLFGSSSDTGLFNFHSISNIPWLSAGTEISPYSRGRENTVWGVSLMLGYLGFDGFTSTFQDKLFKGYDMEIHNQIFYTTLCSCILSLTGEFSNLAQSLSRINYENIVIYVVGYRFNYASAQIFLWLGVGLAEILLLTHVNFALSMMVFVYAIAVLLLTECIDLISAVGLVLQGHLLPAIDFVFRHNDCFFDIALLSTVATASQFFISYTIRTFGALTFAAIMTTRQLLSIVLSCVWFAHPLSWEQWIGAVIVFGSLYARNLLKSTPSKLPPSEHTQNGEAKPLMQ
ncbi:hypothetical protein POTOM_001821 [Populus tomentosa]|uniref:Uncharacterized protein n=1 Tax=Populus tomentosa TaxID=118781 RepID=A0A8X8DIK2_POPTO|nr:hypothetical protein POTOM_001821 [Populus tomentosa]